jgi:SAM-dependent methyltransferase
MQNIIEKNYRNTGNEDILSKLIKPGYVLDVGCGGGDIAKILQSRGFKVDGITISENELQNALPFLNRGYLFNLENGLPSEVHSNKYDYIICSHVLEHICYPDALLKGIYNCITENSIVIVALPNIFHYASRWKLVMGNFDYQESGIWDNTHFKWYTYKTGKELLERNGFRVTYKTVTGQLPFNSFFSKILPSKLSSGIYNMLKKISAGLFGYQLIYVVRK